MSKIKRLLKNPYRPFYHFNYTHLSRLLPDKALIKLVFRARLGYKMNFKEPKTFNQKIQWLKINNRDPLYTKLVDKYEVREYISDTIGSQYLIPLLGVWNSFDEIDFESIPNQFVLKCTHDSGSVIVCRDKNKFDFFESKKQIDSAMQQNFFYRGREWPYKNVVPKIIIEKYMQDNLCESDKAEGLTDYKFYCFDGKARYLYVSKGLEDHSTARISFLNSDWTLASFRRTDFEPFENLPRKPINYDKMIVLAEKLSQGFPFLRVDLYEIDGEVYFSELTFSPCNGFMPFEPKEKDAELGDLIDLSKWK